MLQWLLQREHQSDKSTWPLTVLASHLASCGMSNASQNHIIRAITRLRQVTLSKHITFPHKSASELPHSVDSTTRLFEQDVIAIALLLQHRLTSLSSQSYSSADIPQHDNQNKIDIKHLLYGQNTIKYSAKMAWMYFKILAATLLLPFQDVDTKTSSTHLDKSLDKQCQVDEISSPKSRNRRMKESISFSSWMHHVENELLAMLQRHGDTLIMDYCTSKDFHLVLAELCRSSYAFTVGYAQYMKERKRTAVPDTRYSSCLDGVLVCLKALGNSKSAIGLMDSI